MIATAPPQKKNEVIAPVHNVTFLLDPLFQGQALSDDNCDSAWDQILAVTNFKESESNQSIQSMATNHKASSSLFSHKRK